MRLHTTVSLVVAVLSISACGIPEQEDPVVAQKSDALESDSSDITRKVVEGVTYSQAVTEVSTLIDRGTSNTPPGDQHVTPRITNICSYVYEVCLHIGYSTSTCHSVRWECEKRRIISQIR